MSHFYDASNKEHFSRECLSNSRYVNWEFSVEELHCPWYKSKAASVYDKAYGRKVLLWLDVHASSFQDFRR